MLKQLHLSSRPNFVIPDQRGAAERRIWDPVELAPANAGAFLSLVNAVLAIITILTSEPTLPSRETEFLITP